jgi:polyhydroxyalkanoate synthesis regulator phasin
VPTGVDRGEGAGEIAADLEGTVDIRSNPVVKRVVEAGEAQVGRLANQLLSNERFVQAIQQIVSGTLAAKGTLDKSLRGALATMNLPSTRDVEELRRRLDDLDRTMTELDAKLDRLEDRLGGEGRSAAAAAPAKTPASPKKRTPRKKAEG